MATPDNAFHVMYATPADRFQIGKVELAYLRMLLCQCMEYAVESFHVPLIAMPRGNCLVAQAVQSLGQCARHAIRAIPGLQGRLGRCNGVAKLLEQAAHFSFVHARMQLRQQCSGDGSVVAWKEFSPRSSQCEARLGTPSGCAGLHAFDIAMPQQGSEMLAYGVMAHMQTFAKPFDGITVRRLQQLP